jgi:signal transduction histidine kinase
VFQGIIFRTYYTRERINYIKDEISEFINQDEYDDIQIEELVFSRNTSTFTSIIPLSTLQNSFEELNLVVLEITTSDNTVQIYAPSLSVDTYEIGQEVSSNAFVKASDVYIPTYLAVEGKTLIRKNNSNVSNTELLDIISFEESNIIQLTGTISAVTYNDESELNSLVSNEILNMYSKNYLSIVDYDLGNYYFTSQTTNDSSSLVFYSIVEIDSENHLLVSVYPMDYIDQIVLAAGRANVYMFVVVLLILFISAFFYSREFSKPLIFINKKTKDLSNLNFTSPIMDIDSSDEFSELAQNINTLSANLQTTLYQLNEQNKQLSDTIAKENKVESTRRDFIQGMSHELKTPLAVIQASAEAIQNEIYDTQIEKDKALLLIQEEVTKTKNMLNSMITVYKLDSPDYKEQWATENLKDLVIAIDKSLSPLYINSKIKVELDLEDTFIVCDKDKMETIITNLFTNAIKYTPKSESINILLTDTPNSIRFKITNYGVSISKENQGKLFDAFYRVDKSRGRHEGSTGLGLYIVDQTLKQYNSVCKVSSTTNSVIFSFEIKKSF